MGQLTYKKIDAFTDGISSGNPAGVVYLPAGMRPSAEEMQAIARRFTAKGVEHRVNEVAFLAPLADGSFWIRFYSYNCEVEMCGHATIACMYDLIKNTPALLAGESVVLKTARGELVIMNDIRGSDAVFIATAAPEYRSPSFSFSEAARHLNIAAEEISAGAEPAIVNAGLATLIVPVRSLASVIRMLPDEAALKEFSLANGFDITIVFTPDVSLKTSGYRTRVFAPKYGYLEDPATGSGNAALGHFLLGKKIWDGSLLSIEQGPSADHPNIVKLRTGTAANGGRSVQVGGNGIVRFTAGIKR